MADNLILTTLIALGTGVIGYLINDNRALRAATKSIRALVLSTVAKVLEDENAKKETKEVARKALSELEKI